MVGLVGLSFLLGACAGDVVERETTTSTGVLSSTTTSMSDPGSSSTAPLNGLDLSKVMWVTHGPDGILLDDGSLVWETRPFPAGVARDGEGGFVFTDSTGLWWFPINAGEPTLVREEADDLVAVIGSPAGPVAMIWDSGPVYFRLADGEAVDGPPEVRVEVSPDTPWLWKWTAANGLAAWVTEPKVERDAEGQPSQILEPSHLVVAKGEEVLVDIAVGGVYEAWATIHDFDGQTLILSRGPYEPAMPEETFLLIDLALGQVTRSFIAGGTRATLTGEDVDWNGPVQVPDLGAYTPSIIATDDGVTSLQDGRYVTFIRSAVDDGASLDFDLAVWFTGNEANIAASVDGETDIPVPNDYYIHNADPTTLSLPVDDEVVVTSVWYDYDTDPDLENDIITYQEFLNVIQSDDAGVQSALRTSPWWVTVEDGKIVALDEQYVP
jgi:hypothetical protein